MKRKKGQVMLFVIMGIVILFIFAFLFSFMSSLKKKGLEEEKEKKLSNLKIKREFKGFVSSCLDNSAKEAVFLVGRQGGVIYDYQAKDAARYRGPPANPYGEYVLPYEDKNKDEVYNISYGIEKPEFNDRNHPAPPLYPYGFVKLVEDPTEIDPAYINVFGNFPQPGPFTPLCDYNGRNGPRVASIAHSCETYDSRNEFVHRSVQEYMEAYVTNSTIECAKQNAFKSLNASINTSGVNTSILFSNEKINFKLNFPATIALRDRTIETDFQTFSTSVENRLKLIHELVSHLIEKDVNNVFFDMVNDAHTLTNCRSWGEDGKLCLKEGMSVSKIRNPCKKTDEVECEEGGDYDDLLVVEDKKSYLYGQPYEFYVAIENRPPALDLIYQQEGKVGFEYDFVSFVGEEIVIKPKAYDPDESFHENQRYMQEGYDYGMWKEDYDEVYNKFYCEQNPQKCMDNPGGKATEKITTKRPHNWTKSEKFKDTGRVAKYVTTQSDWGEHTVKVSACDDEGLCDYQKVQIFVGNMFENQSFNPYSDIPGNYTSIEDPYTLVFPDMDVPEEEDKYEFTLKDPSGSNQINKKQEDNYINIPDVEPLNSLGPSELKNNVQNVFPNPGTYKLNFRSFNSAGDEIYSSESANELEVKQCLPHRSERPPYPFTKKSFWQADHACCVGEPENPSQSDWGEYADSFTTCYSGVQKGCFANLSVPPEVDYELDDAPPAGEGNAYKLELEVKCSGDEGYSCTGNADGDVTITEECGPCEKCKAGSGSCVAAPSHSFTCDTDFKCSPGEYQDYGGGGKYACQGTCGATGDCDSAINCSCDANNCAAECEKNWYRWEDDVCKFNCGAGCEYQSMVDTTCSAPSDASYELTIDGNSIYTGNESTGAVVQEDTEINNEHYGSVCTENNRCHVSSCYEDGRSEFSGEECLDPGEKDGNLCYTSPGPMCNASGNCTSVAELPFENNPDSNECHYNLSCTESGWEFEINNTIPPLGNWTNPANTTCYYGSPICDNQSETGWLKLNDTKKPMDNETIGDRCFYNPRCTNDGWSRENETKPLFCMGTLNCTSDGWECV